MDIKFVGLRLGEQLDDAFISEGKGRLTKKQKRPLSELSPRLYRTAKPNREWRGILEKGRIAPKDQNAGMDEGRITAKRSG